LQLYDIRHGAAPTMTGDHLEYWIPAEDLDAFNQAIVGAIEVTAAFGEVAERPA